MPLRSLFAHILTIALSAAVRPVFGQFGSPPARTTSGNADLGLGEYKGLKHAIGCKSFENESGWRGEWQVGENLTVLLESALADTGRFVLVERQLLKDILAEQDLAAGGRAARAGQVARTGGIRPARYIATGVVSEITESQSGAGGGISIRGIRLNAGRSEAQVTVIVKLVDTTTGEIVAKERIVGKAGRTKVGVGLSAHGISTDLGGFVNTPLGQAVQDCVNQAAVFIARKMEQYPFEGSVVKVGEDGRVIINRGAQFGVQVGQELAMVKAGDVLMDPDTGEILEREQGQTIGRLRVVRVSEKVSYCEVIEGEKNPSSGTVVRIKR